MTGAPAAIDRVRLRLAALQSRSGLNIGFEAVLELGVLCQFTDASEVSRPVEVREGVHQPPTFDDIKPGARLRGLDSRGIAEVVRLASAQTRSTWFSGLMARGRTPGLPRRGNLV